MENLEPLVSLQKRNIGEASLVVARAFQDEPLNSHFFPNPDERKEMLPALFEYRLNSAIRHGMVYATSSNMEGIATWLPSDLGKIPLWRMMLSGGFKVIRKLGYNVVSKMMAVNDYAISMKTRNAGDKFLHLEIIAVEPKFQGMGYAKKLLEPMFERLDSEGLPCFLITSTEENVPFYQYFGFEVVEESTIPGPEVSLWAMIREPFTS